MKKYLPDRIFVKNRSPVQTCAGPKVVARTQKLAGAKEKRRGWFEYSN
jgi:hypothetical protein